MILQYILLIDIHTLLCGPELLPLPAESFEPYDRRLPWRFITGVEISVMDPPLLWSEKSSVNPKIIKTPSQRKKKFLVQFICKNVLNMSLNSMYASHKNKAKHCILQQCAFFKINVESYQPFSSLKYQL